MESVSGSVKPNFWKNKKVFLTGHTGFKGSWLSLWLQNMGANVKGFALEPPTKPALFTEAEVAKNMASEIGNIRNLDLVKKSMCDFNPDILIHMAAQSLVRLSYENPIETYNTNVIGTVNILESAKYCSSLKAIVSVTTDKCYENKEWIWAYRENEALGGHDPYSSSKACAELVTSAYRRSFFSSLDTPSIASARAGNVIGGGDWAVDRLVPDILRAFEKKDSIIVRNPMAIRPWQHVLEPLSGYLVLAQNLYEYGDEFAEGWNFGPKEKDCKSVSWILDQMTAKWGEGNRWYSDNNLNPHESLYLKLDISKAAARLNWQPKWDLEYTLNKIVHWHQEWMLGKNMKDKCLLEIEEYQKKAHD